MFLLSLYHFQVRWCYRRHFWIILVRGGGDVQWPYLWVGVGNIMRDMWSNYCFPNSSGPNNFPTPQFCSCPCVVSCHSHAWPSDSTLVEWTKGTIFLLIFLFLDKYGFLCLHVAEDVIFFSLALEPHLTILWGCVNNNFDRWNCTVF